MKTFARLPIVTSEAMPRHIIAVRGPDSVAVVDVDTGTLHSVPSEHGSAYLDLGRDRRVSSGDLDSREDRPAPRPPDEGASR